MTREQEGSPKRKSHSEEQSDPHAVADNIANLIDNLLGDGIYEGGAPFSIQAIDKIDKTAYLIDIRRGIDSGRNNTSWITIQQSVINNPRLVRTYLLEKMTGGEWKYEDPYLAKNGESSLPQLQTVYNRLERAWDTLKPRELSHN